MHCKQQALSLASSPGDIGDVCVRPICRLQRLFCKGASEVNCICAPTCCGWPNCGSSMSWAHLLLVIAMSVCICFAPGVYHRLQATYCIQLHKQLCCCMHCRYAKQKRSKSSSFVPDDDDNGDDGEDDDYGAYDNTLQPQQLQPQQSQSQQGQHKQRSQPPRRTAPAAAITAQGTLTSSGDRNSGLGLGADGPRGSYSDEVLRSLQLVDPSIVNYELIEALLVHIIHVQQQEGPAGLLKVSQWQVSVLLV
eukprot:GHUV01023084.1.p1 GENE.GHUV01023084.1~~GHUV01023084.1.p1  ORF type:complete len:250 (-),score=58.90 GHUV01023084.1:332-1081(-)